MTFAMLIYFIDVVCGSHGGLAVLTGVLAIIWLFGFIVSIVSNLDEDIKPEDLDSFLLVYQSLWPLKTFVILMIALSVIIPSKDTAYKMLAAYGVESLVSNPEVQKLGGKSLDVINKAMDDYLKETKPVVTDKVGK